MANGRGIVKGAAAVLSAALVLEAAVPLNTFAASHSVAVQKIGPSTSLTMTEWNWETVADDPNYAAILPQLIKGFEAMYPHIKVVNTSMSLEEQTDKLPLDFAAASQHPRREPDERGVRLHGTPRGRQRAAPAERVRQALQLVRQGRTPAHTDAVVLL